MISFNPLWKTLIDRGMNRSELTKAGVSSATLAKMKKDGNINIETLDKICGYLNCEITDVVEIKNNPTECYTIIDDATNQDEIGS